METDEKPRPPAKKVAEAMYSEDLNAQHCGIRLLKAGEGHSWVSMSVKKHMLNGLGFCHGGMIFTLAHPAFSYACNSHNQISVAMNCSITFLKPARNGDLLTATAQEQLLEAETESTTSKSRTRRESVWPFSGDIP